MIGSLVGAGLKIGGSIFGGVSAAKAARKRMQMLGQQQKDNQNWYDRRYNEDSTQRSDAQSAINQMRQMMQERTGRSMASNIVAGGTDQALAAEKEAQNNALAGTIGHVVVNGQRRKDNIENQYLQQKQAIEGSMMQAELDKANAISGAVQGVTNTVGMFG